MCIHPKLRKKLNCHPSKWIYSSYRSNSQLLLSRFSTHLRLSKIPTKSICLNQAAGQTRSLAPWTSKPSIGWEVSSGIRRLGNGTIFPKAPEVQLLKFPAEKKHHLEKSHQNANDPKHFAKDHKKRLLDCPFRSLKEQALHFYSLGSNFLEALKSLLS